MVSLRVISGPRAGEQIEVEHEIVFGRHGTDVIIDDAELSRRHLSVRPDGNVLIVEDLGSTNGTFVDDERIGAPMHLADGARIKLGSTVLEVSVVPSAQATRMATAAPADTAKTSMRSVPTGPPPAAVPVAPPPPVAPVPAPVAAAVPAPVAAAVPAPAVAAPAPAAGPPHGRAPQGELQIGAFNVSHKRRGGLASRSWVPVALSFGTVIATAAVLVFYFATRAHP